MARFTDPSATVIYQLAGEWFDKCLDADGSLIQSGTELWTQANLDRLHKVFVGSVDEGPRSFLEKLADQLKPEGAEICWLMGELLAVYFLFPSSVGAKRKAEVINQVLSWGGQAIPAGSSIDRAIKDGIGSAGQGYNTRRPHELAFFIELARHWKKLSKDERNSAHQDPWIFRKVVDSMEISEGKQGRHMILHLLFPDQFERIASGRDKQLVINEFKSLQGERSDAHYDEAILSIRNALQSLLGEAPLDFYRSPLKEIWKGSDTGEDGISMDVLRHKKQIVLYGPPGTGKTYGANVIADRIIRSALLKKWGAKTYFDRHNAGSVEVEIKRRVHALQLHAAYGYEEFIRALHLDKTGATVYRRGALPRLIELMRTDDRDVPHVLILDEINRTDLSRMLGECFSLLENREKQVDLPAHDEEGRVMTLTIPSNLYIIGTMNLIDQSIEQMDFALRRRFLWQFCRYDSEALLQAAKDLWDDGNANIEWERVEEDFKKLALAASELNAKIHSSPHLGDQYEIGHTYFLDTVAFLKADFGARPSTYLWTKKGKAKAPVEQTWKYSLKPLISEYLAGLETRSRDAEIARLETVFLNVPEAVE